jgi:Signal transduction histidine kinase
MRDPAPALFSANAPPPRVLVIDDEPRIRAGCQAVLSKEGYALTLAGDASEGLAALEREPFDIILLDLMMPKISGFEASEQIRERYPGTVIIVITGYATLEHSVEAMKRGAFDFLPKPFTSAQLRVVVKKGVEHTRALQDIASERSRMRLLVNRLSDGVLATDREMRLVLCNPVSCQLLSVEGPTPIGQPLASLHPPEPVVALVRQSLEDGSLSERSAEVTVTLPAETEPRILSVRCTPLTDRGTLVLGTLTVLQDITEQKRSDQLKSDFVSLVAHEIRSPLSSILMQLEVVRDGLAGPVTPKQTEILERVASRVQSLVDMASELLDLSRIEAGLLAEEREAVDLVPLVRERLEQLIPLAEQKQLTLSFEAQPAEALLTASRRAMEEVVDNLVSNAIKYTPEGGSVTVTLQSSDAEWILAVADTGFGIPPEDQENVFRRFYRVRSPETRTIMGTGLGLPIVKRIVEAHRGRIQLQSTPGAGSTFTLYLPR